MAESGEPARIVVFGGIGSGKTVFASLLGELGALVIDADRIGHEVLSSTGGAFAAVAERWPDVVRDGEIDRAALAAIVFNDRPQLEELEAITHPLIGAEIMRRADAAGEMPVVVELPLVRAIAGDGWTWVLVDAPREQRLERAVARGASAEDIAARMDSQPDDAEWYARADWVIPNTGSVEDLAAAAAELWRAIGAT